MKKLNKLASYILMSTMAILGACTQDSPITTPAKEESTPIDRTTFAKGADVSWLTQLEAEGAVFKNSDDVEMECMQLLKEECGVNSIRLRVWVNPEAGWNNIDDVVVKARRANDLGMRVMIDFHFSDTWADPANQVTPATWTDYSIDELKVAVAEHVTAMMKKLQAYDVMPEWVQIGNETRGGMLYPLGAYTNGQNFADLVNAGYDAVKAIFPDSKIIIHLDSGNRIDIYTRIFGTLKTYGGKYDMIGMSLYPEVNNWQSMVNDCVTNINSVIASYGKPVMICEVGMAATEAETANKFMTLLKSRCETETNGKCEGIFYWEPEAPVGYNGGYNKGCFIDGVPTEALNAFK